MSWSVFATLGILAATIHWFVGRSSIMRWFWDAIWLPSRINGLLGCAACSGWWLGLGLGAAAPGLRPLLTGHWWLDVVLTGAAGMWATPVVEGVLMWGLRQSKID